MKVRKRDRAPDRPERQATRCAIYTRKSSEEGLDQEFNSLDAQREAAEAFIASQKSEGWECLPQRYDDGGFSGGSMDRPALDRLLADIDAGKIDCVVVYKVDRLSRSLMDFAKIMGRFDAGNTAFVSVTQQFNTTSSMGRLTLNILLSFAQFEREIIGERIRDKVAAQKAKGKWGGGVPVLGYDVDRSGPSPKLVVNAAEAARVREMFDLYLAKQSLMPVVEELDRRGWTNKLRRTRKGKLIGGKPFNRATLYTHLLNPIYVGKISHKGVQYDGEHEPIVDRAKFDEVARIIAYNGRTGGFEVRNKYGSLLRGMLRCKACGYAMSHTFTAGRSSDSHRHRYYRCIKAMKNGAKACPSKTLPAPEIEKIVIEEVRALASDRSLLKQVIAESQAAVQAEIDDLKRHQAEARKALKRDHAELQRMAGAVGDDLAQALADVQARIEEAEATLRKVETDIMTREHTLIGDDEAKAAFSDFDAMWETLIPREQARLLRLLIETVEYDVVREAIDVTFRTTSIRSLIKSRQEGAA